MHCNNGLNNKLVESLVENKVAQETGDLKYLQESMYDFISTIKEIILGEYSPEFFNKYVDEALKLHGSNLEEFLKIPKMGLELRQALNSIDEAIDTSNQEFRDNLVLLLDRFQTTLDNMEYEARDPYDTAVELGFTGTKQEWIKHLEGDSAYDIAVKNGYEGTQSQWLKYIRADGFIQSIQQFATNDSETQVQIPDYGTINSLQGYIKELFENGGLPATPFKTKALMAASSLDDGKYAQVTDDEDNNGLYIKTAGSWVKSGYDLINLAKIQAKRYIENELLIPPNEVEGDLVRSRYLAIIPEDVENPDDMEYRDTSNSTSFLIIYPVEPSTDYTLIKELSNRFRVAEFDEYPSNGLMATGVYVKSSDNLDEFEGSDGVKSQQVSFMTSPVAKYLVVYFTSDGETPKAFLRKEGSFELEEDSFEFRKDVVFGNAKLSDVSKLNDKIKQGKNLFKKEDYLEGKFGLLGAVGSVGGLTEGRPETNGKTAVLKIEPDTTYTISKSTSDRFRVGICDSYSYVGSNQIEVLAGEENDRANIFTFTSKSTTNYLVLYLSLRTSPPSEVQVEIGDVATPFESYGFKLFPEAKSNISTSASDAYGNAGVGDANYISKDEGTSGAWKDSQYSIPATDDTDTLQALFDSAKGVVSLEPGKKYKITRTITFNPERVKLIKGNMAHIVCIGDIVAFHMLGTLSRSANAGAMDRDLAYNEMSPMVVALKITNPMEVLGTAFVINNVMSPIILGCNFAYLRRGIVFRGNNRNAILNSNHIYACSDYGIHLEEGGNLHQVNIVGNHISYCRKNIFSENHHIYNIQITGNDIETSSYPTKETGGRAECNMHFLQTTAILEDLEVVGNTIEDHHSTWVMIKLEGNTSSTNNISCVTISGNVIGNSGRTVIEIGGASGVEITGQYKANLGYIVDVLGDLNGLKLSTQSKQSGGGLFRADGDYSLKDITVCGNNQSGSVVHNSILVDVTSLDNCNFSDNDLRVIGTRDFHDTHKAPITVHADTLKMVRVDGNNIANTSATTKAVEVVARDSSQKGSMRGNMANYGSFTAPESFSISEND